MKFQFRSMFADAEYNVETQEFTPESLKRAIEHLDFGEDTREEAVAKLEACLNDTETSRGDFFKNEGKRVKIHYVFDTETNYSCSTGGEIGHLIPELRNREVEQVHEFRLYDYHYDRPFKIWCKDIEEAYKTYHLLMEFVDSKTFDRLVSDEINLRKKYDTD